MITSSVLYLKISQSLGDSYIGMGRGGIGKLTPKTKGLAGLAKPLFCQVVPKAGVEPAHLAATVFETVVSTNSTTSAREGRL